MGAMFRLQVVTVPRALIHLSWLVKRETAALRMTEPCPISPVLLCDLKDTRIPSLQRLLSVSTVLSAGVGEDVESAARPWSPGLLSPC